MANITPKQSNDFIENNPELLCEMWEYEASNPEPTIELTPEEFEIMELYHRLKVFQATKKYDELCKRQDQ